MCDVTKVGVAGDWHGNRPWALHSIRALAEADVHEIFHLGDFGIWPGRSGRDYLLDVTSALDSPWHEDVRHARQPRGL